MVHPDDDKTLPLPLDDTPPSAPDTSGAADKRIPIGPLDV